MQHKATTTGPLTDSHQRVIRDLRISVTDRCNFRCLYCLPETEAAHNFYRGRWATLPNSTPIARKWKARDQLLTFEEIERVVRLAVVMGVNKIRLTGGEPLLRQQIEELVARLSAIPGIEDLAMTSNGFSFMQKGEALQRAGLHRMSFSLDSLDRETFKKMTGRDALAEVLASIRHARDLGMSPVKVNAVVIRDLNDSEVESLAEFAREENLCMRFIEFMPLDSGRAWLKELVVSGAEILKRLQSQFGLEQAPAHHKSETAKRWVFPDGRGEIGIVAPVSEPFCGHCNRIRLTSDGQVRTCLFSLVEHNIKDLLRNGASDESVQQWLRDVVWQKEARHHIGEPEFKQPERTMSCIGG